MGRGYGPLRPPTPSVPLLPKLEVPEYQIVAFNRVLRLVEGRRGSGRAQEDLRRPALVCSDEGRGEESGGKDNSVVSVGRRHAEPGRVVVRVWTKLPRIPLPYLY